MRWKKVDSLLKCIIIFSMANFYSFLNHLNVTAAEKNLIAHLQGVQLYISYIIFHHWYLINY